MKTGIMLLGAFALGLAAPLAASDLAEGEIALRINAQGTIPADYALFRVEMRAVGDDKVAAESDLHQQERDAVAALEQLGVRKSLISLTEPSIEKSDEVEWRVLEAAPLDEPAAETPVTAPDVAVAPPQPRASPIERITTVDLAEPSDETVLTTHWTASSTMMVMVEDMSKLAEVRSVARSGYDYVGTRPTFHFRDEAKSEREAIAAAFAKARADAEVYADALGYKVVRIVAVSNDGPPLSVPGIIQTIASIDNIAREWTLMGQKTAVVSVDFAIAPK